MKHALAAIALAMLCACSSSGGSGAYPSLPSTTGRPFNAAVGNAARGPSSGKIKHVVILIQENRSFNNLFYGFKGAKTVGYGYDSNNQKIALAPIGFEARWDIDHSSAAYFAACNGTGKIPGTECRMNGFNHEIVGCGGRSDPCPDNPPYAYVPRSETKPYFDMGAQYVLADEMYASNFDASSFISHQYIIAGQALAAVNYPYSAWGCPGGPSDKIATVGPRRQLPYGKETVCWDPTTLGDELDDAGIPWAFYTATLNGDLGIWSAYQAIKHIYNGRDWQKDILTPQTAFFDDVAKGRLRAVSWITPTWENSDHAGSASKTGPSWVASVVNSIGKSQYWKSTAVFVFWDDYGGWYDPEPPKYVDYDGLGMRIPLLIVSAYAKKGHVSHVHYEHGSILRFVEDTFGLPRLADSDKRANSPTDAFDFTKPARRFVPIKSPLGENYFRLQPVDHRPPDDE